jgi:subtilase family serine protease
VVVDPTTGYGFTADGTGGGYAGKGDMGVLPLFLDVEDPGSEPDVTDVGGTDLQWSQNAEVETSWSGDGLSSFGAGGGGISSVFPMPSYQAGIVDAQSSGTPCGAAAGDDCREVPDVAADADPYDGYVIYYDGEWKDFGGTSGATPVWAAVTALAVTFNGTVERLGDINPDLYAFAAKGYPAFTDITEGDNDYTTTNGGAYAAGPGYDMATGLGSPRASVLAPDLDPFVISAEPDSQTVVVGQDASFTVATTGTPIPTVQWEVSTDGGSTFSDIPGATSDTYEFTAEAAQNGYQYQAEVSNSVGSIATTVATLHVFSVTTTSLPGATPGTAYRVHLNATGGPTPYSWTIAGALPKGLKLSPSGVVSGKPDRRDASGTYTVTVTATTAEWAGHPSLAANQTLVLTLL